VPVPDLGLVTIDMLLQRLSSYASQEVPALLGVEPALDSLMAGLRYFDLPSDPLDVVFLLIASVSWARSSHAESA
jgi:hypothetical protein